MKMKIVIGIVVIIIIAVLLIVLLPKKENSKEIEITKVISAGIPFRWEYEIKDKDIVEFVRSYVIKDENTGGKVGAKVHTNYVFKGLKEGNTDITFRVVSITNEYEPYDETVYHIIVDKDLNIRITE